MGITRVHGVEGRLKKKQRVFRNDELTGAALDSHRLRERAVDEHKECLALEPLGVAFCKRAPDVRLSR